MGATPASVFHPARSPLPAGALSTMTTPEANSTSFSWSFPRVLISTGIHLLAFSETHHQIVLAGGNAGELLWSTCPFSTTSAPRRSSKVAPGGFELISAAPSACVRLSFGGRAVRVRALISKTHFHGFISGEHHPRAVFAGLQSGEIRGAAHHAVSEDDHGSGRIRLKIRRSVSRAPDSPKW